MATKKLSEALAELQKAANVSGLDIRLVVAGQSSTDNAQTITLQQLLTAINVPTVQTSTNGNNKQYIYSDEKDEKKDVLCGVYKIYQNSGKLKICHKIWGADNSNYDDGKMHTKEFPIVNTGSDGAADHYVHARLMNNTLYEGSSTTDAVVINYTNFAASGNKTFKLTAASSAKAGVMTSEQYNQLKDLDIYIRGSLGTFTTTNDFKTAMANMPTTHKGMYGRYYAVVSGTNVYITFVLLEESSNTFAQWVEGALIKNNTDGDIYLNNELGVHIIGRVYRNGSWGMWRSTVLDDEVNSSGPSAERQYLKWDSDNHKYTYVATEAESNAVIPIANGTKDGLMSKEDAKSLSEIQSSYKDLGNFASENAALAKIKSLEVCADSNIVHAHLTYANGSGKNTIILIQSIDNTMCRQIILNKMKAFHRTITFTDASRTAIQTQEDWMFLFGDRLAWSPSQNKYVLSQFGNNYGWDYTDPIPTATTTNDGLMSKSQATDLANVKNKLGNIQNEIPIATEDYNGLMSASQCTDLIVLQKTTKKKKTTNFAPCVHKAIPLMPKKGRRYFNREGLFYFNVKKISIINREFNYVDNIVGSLKYIRVVKGKDPYVDIKENLQDYFSINKNNWVDLFGEEATKVQFCVESRNKEGLPNYCIEILSDQAIVFSEGFRFYFYNENTFFFKETASPLFIIEKWFVKYTPDSSRLTNNTGKQVLIPFYKRNNKHAKTYKGGYFIQNQRWRRVKQKTLGYFNLNKRAYTFRIYKGRRKWNRVFMSNVYFNVLRNFYDKDINKFIP